MASNGRDQNSTPAQDRKGDFVKQPATLIEIESGFVAGARLTGAPKRALRRLAVTALDAGIIEPSPSQLNVIKPEMLTKAIKTVLNSIGGGNGRAGLLLPDAIARVSILEFETLPKKIKEMEALLRWRIKDSLGFPPEEARLSYQELRRSPGAIEILVVAVRKDVLAQYEAVLDSVLGGPILTLPATLALLPLLSETEPGSQLLTHVCSGWVTHTVVEGNRLRFWRSRQFGREDPASETGELVSEAARAAASARDRLGLELARAWLCVRPLAGDGLKEDLRRTLNVQVEDLPLNGNFEAGLGSEERPLFNLFAAPLAGIISNFGRTS